MTKEHYEVADILLKKYPSHYADAPHILMVVKATINDLYTVLDLQSGNMYYPPKDSLTKIYELAA